jgi:pimeloyl-ACP methyl ester carboxylesterase
MRYLLSLPQGYDSETSYPLWLVLHGAYATAEQSMALFEADARRCGAVLLAPQASRPCGEGYCWSFARDSAGIDQILAALPFGFDAAQSALIGYSMGCTQGGWVLGRHPERFGCFAAVGMGSAFEAWEHDDGGIDLQKLGLAAGFTRFFLAIDRSDPGGSDGYFDDNLKHFSERDFSCASFRPDSGTHDFTDEMRQAVLEKIQTQS